MVVNVLPKREKANIIISTARVAINQNLKELNMIKVLDIRSIFLIIFVAALPMCALGFLTAVIGDDIDIILLLPLSLVFLLGGVFVPIASYIWYVRHGGRWKWIAWIVFAPLILLPLILWLLSFLVDDFTADLVREYYDSHRCHSDYGCLTVITPEHPIEILTRRLSILGSISFLFNGIVFPIVFYNWYIARGGKKFWLSYLACVPLIIMMLILFWNLFENLTSRADFLY